MAARRRKRKVTKRFYVILSVVVALLGSLAMLLVFGMDRYGQVTTGSMSLEKDVSVIIVRDEMVYSVANYAAASFFATEGEAITQGTTVAQVYKWGFNNKLLTDLISVQEQIRDVQENEIWAEVVNSNLNEINAKINNKIQEIAVVVQGDSSADIVLLERKLKELFEQKQSFLRRNVQADARLDALYAKEQEALTLLSNWREDVTAQTGGVVSFYLDGLEKQLTPYNLDTLTRDDILNARKGVVTSAANGKDSTKPLYRLVNNYKWYCVIHVDSSDAIEEMKEGGDARLTFEGYYDRPYTAKIISVRAVEGGGMMYVLEMSEDVSPLLCVRTANARLLLNFEGIKVPSDAIHTQNRQAMLKINLNNTLRFVKVDVLIDDGEYCIIRNLESDVVIDESSAIILR
jgi:putative membrane fusion protein